MSTIRIGTLNLNGARDIKKRAVLFELIRQKSLDVMMVQETHSDSLNEIDWKKEWDGEVVFAHMNSVRGGVAVLFAKNFLPISYELKHVIPGRLMLLRAKFERFNFTLQRLGLKEFIFLTMLIVFCRIIFLMIICFLGEILTAQKTIYWIETM